MARSVLLQLARDSIQEVFEAKRGIDKPILLQTYPLVAQNIKTSLKIYLEGKLRGSCIEDKDISLLESIIKCAKKAAFEDKNFSPLTTSEYLSCEIEITLFTQDT